MSDDVESGLRTWLAHRERLAAAVTSPARVIEGVESAVARRQGVRRWGLAPAAAGLAVAVVLAAVIAGSVGLRSHTSAPAQPVHTPPWVRGPVPRTPPPAGVPVTYLHDPRDATTLVAFDWTGRAVGSLRLPAHPNGLLPSFIASPDGSRLIVDSSDWSSQWVIDSQGRRLFSVPYPSINSSHVHDSYPARFADDNRTVCEERYDLSVRNAPRTLFVIGGDGTVLRQISEAPPGDDADASWGLDTCSVKSDTAVFTAEHTELPQVVSSSQTVTTSSTTSGRMGIVSVGGMGATVRMGPRWAVMVREVRLSTGAEKYRHIYADQTVVTVRASADGSILLEEAEVGGHTDMRDVRTGRVVAVPLPGGGSLMSDGHLLVTEWGSNRTPGKLTLLDWRTGTILWSQLVPGGSDLWASQAGGDSFVEREYAIDHSCGVLYDYVMFDQNGTPTRLTHTGCGSGY